MIWSSATGSETFALARLFSNSPMERRPSSVLFWSNSQCLSTMLRCFHFWWQCCLSKWKLKGKITLSVYPCILCFVDVFQETNLPWLPLLRGVFFVESWCPDFVTGKKCQLQWKWQTTVPPKCLMLFSSSYKTIYSSIGITCSSTGMQQKHSLRNLKCLILSQRFHP